MTDQTRRDFLVASGSTMAAMALLPELGLGAPFRLDEPLRVGLIGVGRQGRAILAEIQKFQGLECPAICDNDDSRLRAGQRRARGAQPIVEHEALLERRDIDAVFIATPTHLHRQIALDALAAGKHVFCEGPLASTIEDCRAIAAAARTSNRVFQVGMYGRSNPIYKLALSFARSGSIRDVVSLRGQSHAKTSWRSPAPDPALEKQRNWRLDPEVSIGLAGEIGTHQLDVLNWFGKQYPTAVRGAGSIQLHKDGREIADTIDVQLDYPDGTRLTYDATLANSYGGEHELIFGTMGTIKLAWTHGWLFKEADAPTQGWEVYANRQRFHNEEGITLIADATQLASQGKLQEGVGLAEPSLYYAIEDFLRSVTEGAEVACSAAEGLRGAVVGIMANRAVVSGEDVTIDPGLYREG